MKLSTFVTRIKEYQYAEYGNDLIGTIRLLGDNKVQLETVVTRQNHDRMNDFQQQIKFLAGEIQYHRVNKTGCEVELVSVNKKARKDGRCYQDFEVRITL